MKKHLLTLIAVAGIGSTLQARHPFEFFFDDSMEDLFTIPTRSIRQTSR